LQSILEKQTLNFALYEQAAAKLKKRILNKTKLTDNVYILHIDHAKFIMTAQMCVE